MSFRENRGKLQTKQATSVAREPEKQCIHRTWTPVGKLRCNCSHQPVVYGCDLPWVSSGYCMSNGFEKMPADGPVVLRDGQQIFPSDERMAKFIPWVLKDGEVPTTWQVIACARCPKRVDPPPHISRLRQLGVKGNYDPDTGKCDILHVAIEEQKWVQHADDWTAASPPSLRSCTINANRVEDLGPFIEATGCRLLLGHTANMNPSVCESAAHRFPNVRFLIVFHGSQNSMAVNSVWMKNQRKFLELTESLPNLWYGTPEPTIPFGIWYKKFLTYPNTFPFEMPTEPRRLQDPPVLLFAGRDDVIKGYGASVLAAAIVAKNRPVRLESIVKGNPSALRDLAAAAKIELKQERYRSSGEFRAYFRDHVSVLLNQSLTDAFQYVGMDALTQGRPVVGSQTIRYLPKKWQADPNDPYDIARIVMEILDDYDAASAEALKLAGEVRDKQRDEYHRLIERILS